MKLIQFRNESGHYYGWLDGQRAVATGHIDHLGPAGLPGQFKNWPPDADRAPVATFDLERVELLPPVTHPGKVICVGRNYADHASEMGAAVESLPVIFNKFPEAIAATNAEIELPELSDCVDFEAELVVVIGRGGRHIPLENAMDHVFGYCCGNDVSARDWQKGKPGGQWLLGKTFDSFAPIGPWIAPKDEIDPDNLPIRLHLNGELMQSGHTSALIFKIDFLIHHLSRFCTLRTGDLIFTGTPAGVGAGRTPAVFLKPGDETVVEIPGLGKLVNRFIKCPGSPRS